MDEYEISDLIISYSSAGMTAMALYLTAVTGYLVAAFVAGDRLTRLQVTIINVLFLFISGLFIFGTTGYFVRQMDYIQKLRELSPEESVLMSIGVILFIGITMVLGTIACLSFMWSARHPKKE